MPSSIVHDLGSALDGVDDPRIGGATAHVARHAIDDLLLGRMRILCQQRRSLHDLPGLAVATLRHLMLDPCRLHGMSIGRIEAFDGGDQLAFDGPDADRTGGI